MAIPPSWHVSILYCNGTISSTHQPCTSPLKDVFKRADITAITMHLDSFAKLLGKCRPAVGQLCGNAMQHCSGLSTGLANLEEVRDLQKTHAHETWKWAAKHEQHAWQYFVLHLNFLSNEDRCCVVQADMPVARLDAPHVRLTRMISCFKSARTVSFVCIAALNTLLPIPGPASSRNAREAFMSVPLLSALPAHTSNHCMTMSYNHWRLI